MFSFISVWWQQNFAHFKTAQLLIIFVWIIQIFHWLQKFWCGSPFDRKGPHLNINTVFLVIKISFIKIRWWDGLIFTMGIPMLVRRHLYIETVPRLFNSLWPCDAIWRQSSGSTLVWLMACCLRAPSHHLNQCWLVISKVQWHSSITEISLNIYYLKFHSHHPGPGVSSLTGYMYYVYLLFRRFLSKTCTPSSTSLSKSPSQKSKNIWTHQIWGKDLFIEFAWYFGYWVEQGWGFNPVTKAPIINFSVQNFRLCQSSC